MARKPLAGELKQKEVKSEYVIQRTRSKLKVSESLKRFGYDDAVGIERGYVYFNKFKSYYTKKLFPSVDSSQKLLSMLNRTQDILLKARDIQVKREKSFIEQIRSAGYPINSNLTKFFGSDRPYLKVTPTDYSQSKIVQEYSKFLHNFLVNEQLARSVEEILTNSKVFEAFKRVVQRWASEQMLSEKIDLKASTQKLYNDIWKEISLVYNKDPRVGDLQLPEELDDNLLSAFKGIGTLYNETIIKGMIKNSKIDETELNKLHSGLKGATDEVINVILMKFKEMDNIKIETDYKGTSQINKENTSYGKVDLSTLTTFSINGQKIFRRINFSAKSPGLIKTKNSSRRYNTKLADLGVLRTRETEIYSFLNASFGNDIGPNLNFNELFFMIRNHLANDITFKENQSVTKIIAYSAINWMFKDSIQELETTESDLNFFLVNGKIIPTSVIFDFMIQKIKGIGSNPAGIVKITRKNPGALRDWYYTKEVYNDIQSHLGPMNKVPGESQKSYAWNLVKDYVLDNSKIGFQINTARIYSMLELENLKY